MKLKKQDFDIVKEIDQRIREHDWFDFHVTSYDGRFLEVVGSIDLSYYHQLEIIFEEVFFASIFFEEWHSDTKKPVIELPDSDFNKELNERLEIEQGYQIFIIRTEDYKNDIYIAAKKISYNTDTVYYYDKPDLKENERLAEFVKKK